MPGPARTPTTLLKMTGSWRGKKREKTEPKAPPAKPLAPEHLDAIAATKFADLERILAAAGLSSEMYAEAMTLYAAAYSRWREAEGHLRDEGAVVKSPNGYPIHNPMLAVSAAAVKTMIQLLQQFGMTPAALSRVNAPKSEPESDDLANFAIRRGA